jgi:hypothetical protein
MKFQSQILSVAFALACLNSAESFVSPSLTSQQTQPVTSALNMVATTDAVVNGEAKHKKTREVSFWFHHHH